MTMECDEKEPLHLEEEERAEDEMAAGGDSQESQEEASSSSAHSQKPSTSSSSSFADPQRQQQQQQSEQPSAAFSVSDGKSGNSWENKAVATTSGTSGGGLAPPPKRLFSACATSSVSDCGSELTRSLDDLELGSLRSRADTKTEGTIRLNISNLSTLRAKNNSAFNYIGNLPWRLAAKTECSKRTSHLKFFSVYIDCNPESESTLWSCDAVVDFRLLPQKPNQQAFSRQFTNKFNFNSNNWGFPSFIEWSEILNPEKGFIRGDRVVVEARITVIKVVGVRKNVIFDFMSVQPDLSDVALIINGVRLYVSKQYLALYSRVFHAMFFHKFAEREKKEIPLEDVILDEFVEMLHVVYPSHKPVTGDNVEFLLDLGDKFEIQFVMDECEKFLMVTDEIAMVTKLVWADQYCLSRLQDSCLRTFKVVNDVKAVKQTDEYKSLSDTTKAALLEKLLKILKD